MRVFLFYERRGDKERNNSSFRQAGSVRTAVQAGKSAPSHVFPPREGVKSSPASSHRSPVRKSAGQPHPVGAIAQGSLPRKNDRQQRPRGPRQNSGTCVPNMPFGEPVADQAGLALNNRWVVNWMDDRRRRNHFRHFNRNRMKTHSSVRRLCLALLACGAAATFFSGGLPQATAKLPEFDVWEVAQVNGQRMGYAQTTLRLVEESGRQVAKLRQVMKLSLQRFGQETSMEIDYSRHRNAGRRAVRLRTCHEAGHDSHADHRQSRRRGTRYSGSPGTANRVAGPETEPFRCLAGGGRRAVGGGIVALRQAAEAGRATHRRVPRYR